MKITGIEYLNDELKITTNSNVSFMITKDTSLEYPLEEEQELSEDKLFEILYYDMTYKARIIALKFVSSRLRSEKEVRDYIRAKGYDDIIQDNVLESLRELGYVDDEEFAKCFVRDGMNLKKQGKQRLSFELKQKGICEENIQKALAQLAGHEVKNALEILRKKNFETADFKERVRITNYLKRKGYSYDTIKHAEWLLKNE